MKATKLKILFLGIIIMTYSLPWTTVVNHTYTPTQFFGPWLRYAMTKCGITEPTDATPPTLDDLRIYEPTLQYLALTEAEGGPRFPVMYELMAYAMVFTIIMLFIPVRIVNIFGYGLTFVSSFMFAAAIMAIEGRKGDAFGIGLAGTVVGSFTFFIISFFI